MGNIAYIAEPVKCDFCGKEGNYDAKTALGPWAYLCEDHYEIYGIGLGTGMGQRLIVGNNPHPTRE